MKKSDANRVITHLIKAKRRRPINLGHVKMPFLLRVDKKSVLWFRVSSTQGANKQTKEMANQSIINQHAGRRMGGGGCCGGGDGLAPCPADNRRCKDPPAHRTHHRVATTSCVFTPTDSHFVFLSHLGSFHLPLSPPFLTTNSPILHFHHSVYLPLSSNLFLPPPPLPPPLSLPLSCVYCSRKIQHRHQPVCVCTCVNVCVCEPLR